LAGAIKHLEENLGAADVKLSDEDLREIDGVLAKVRVDGQRLPSPHFEQSDIGARAGTSSAGSNGMSAAIDEPVA
jgi:hypothetical protein